MLGVHSSKKQKVHWLAEVAGWTGAFSVLLAYVLALYGFIEANGFWYAFLNLAGAVGIMTIAFVKRVVQSVLLNLIWAIIAVVGMVSIWLK